MGSITEITNRQGALQEAYTYDVYGKPTIYDATNQVLTASAIGNRYMFTGREYDQETGLYHYRYRDYHPLLGRFLQNDPLGFYDSLNLYGYVFNSPNNWVDPWGEQAMSSTGGFPNIPVFPQNNYICPIDIAPEAIPSFPTNDSSENNPYPEFPTNWAPPSPPPPPDDNNDDYNNDKEKKEKKNKKEHRKKKGPKGGKKHQKHTKYHSSRNSHKAKERLKQEGKWYYR